MRGILITKELAESLFNEKRDSCFCRGRETESGEIFITENTYNLFKDIFPNNLIISDLQIEFKKQNLD